MKKKFQAHVKVGDKVEALVLQKEDKEGRLILSKKRAQYERAWGEIEGKLGWIAGQEPSFSPEFEACKRIAEAAGVPLKDVYETAQRAYYEAQKPTT